MPRTNLLIADDVGLRKTIEAGLVLQELILRHRVRTVMVVCPASLQVQWRDEMREKFGLEFCIVNRDLAPAAYVRRVRRAWRTANAVALGRPPPRPSLARRVGPLRQPDPP
jgi:hypothetical protein